MRPYNSLDYITAVNSSICLYLGDPLMTLKRDDNSMLHLDHTANSITFHDCDARRSKHFIKGLKAFVVHVLVGVIPV